MLRDDPVHSEPLLHTADNPRRMSAMVGRYEDAAAPMAMPTLLEDRANGSPRNGGAGAAAMRLSSESRSARASSSHQRNLSVISLGSHTADDDDAAGGKPGGGPGGGPGGRLVELDVLRGFIMFVMALDHCVDLVCRCPITPGLSSKEEWSGEPVYPKSAYYRNRFATRFITDICAPGFCLLMGCGMVLFGRSRRAKGWADTRVLGFHCVRGVVLFCPCSLVVEHYGFLLPDLVYAPPFLATSAFSFFYLLTTTPQLVSHSLTSLLVVCQLGTACRSSRG